jgi:hypothetical protein
VSSGKFVELCWKENKLGSAGKEKAGDWGNPFKEELAFQAKLVVPMESGSPVNPGEVEIYFVEAGSPARNADLKSEIIDLQALIVLCRF